MAEKAWKRAERRIAAVLGGERLRKGGTPSADVESDWAVAEVKHRKKLPAWIKAGVRQAEDHAPASKIALCILVEANTNKTLVVMDIGMFDLWFGADRKAKS